MLDTLVINVSSASLFYDIDRHILGKIHVDFQKCLTDSQTF